MPAKRLRDPRAAEVCAGLTACVCLVGERECIDRIILAVRCTHCSIHLLPVSSRNKLLRFHAHAGGRPASALSSGRARA